MKTLTRLKFFLWYFGHFKVPLIGYVRPKLIKIDDNEIVVKIPLLKRNRNHLHSMYFGALSIGADIAGGIHGFYHAAQQNAKVSLVFKSFEAQFLFRPESSVYFQSVSGQLVKEMLIESKQRNERINKPIPITALIDYPENPKEVARFILELSIKVIE